MKLSQHTDYALRALIYLAVHPDTPATVEQIAQAHGLSSHHLAKIVQELVHHGWVDSTRGRGGGLDLACPPEQINLGQVVRKMETSMALVECMGENSTCAIESACELKGILFAAQKAFLDALDAHTLADATKHPRKMVQLLVPKKK